MYLELLYPIFLEASKYAKDTFWKYIFEDLAYGRTPYGVYITKNFICCNYKNKEFSYKIDKNKGGKAVHDELYNILSNKFGLLSIDDKRLLRNKFDEAQQNTSILANSTWSGIKKKNIKNLMIENFVIDMKKKYNLTLSQTKELLSIITIGLIFKTISNDDIDYSDGKINNIEGIIIKKNNIIIDTNIYNFETMVVQQTQQKKKLSDFWDKYINNIKT